MKQLFCKENELNIKFLIRMALNILLFNTDYLPCTFFSNFFLMLMELENKYITWSSKKAFWECDLNMKDKGLGNHSKENLYLRLKAFSLTTQNLNKIK